MSCGDEGTHTSWAERFPSFLSACRASELVKTPAISCAHCTLFIISIFLAGLQGFSRLLHCSFYPIAQSHLSTRTCQPTFAASFQTLTLSYHGWIDITTHWQRNHQHIVRMHVCITGSNRETQTVYCFAILSFKSNQIMDSSLLIVDCQRRLAIDAETRIIGILETGLTDFAHHTSCAQKRSLSSLHHSPITPRIIFERYSGGSIAKEASLRIYFVSRMTQMCLSIGGCSMKLGVTVPCSQAECCCLADTITEAFRRRAFMLFV